MKIVTATEQSSATMQKIRVKSRGYPFCLDPQGLRINEWGSSHVCNVICRFYLLHFSFCAFPFMATETMSTQHMISPNMEGKWKEQGRNMQSKKDGKKGTVENMEKNHAN
jgi:hypothetical protein